MDFYFSNAMRISCIQSISQKKKKNNILYDLFIKKKNNFLTKQTYQKLFLVENYISKTNIIIYHWLPNSTALKHISNQK